jgi:hypothetical protein
MADGAVERAPTRRVRDSPDEWPIDSSAKNTGMRLTAGVFFSPEPSSFGLGLGRTAGAQSRLPREICPDEAKHIVAYDAHRFSESGDLVVGFTLCQPSLTHNLSAIFGHRTTPPTPDGYTRVA